MALMPKVGELLFEEGALAGSVATVAVIALAPVLGRIARPVARELIRGGYAAVHKTREVAVDTGERWQDLVAEARSELAEEAARPRR